MDIKENILGTIGNTPMVRINRLNPNPAVNIFAKLEGFNPTGSIKDRIALKMIEDAEADGRLKPGQTIIEPTSGNTGIGLAIVGIIKGYSVEIVMSDAVSAERRKIIRSYGATVTLTPGNEGTDGAIRLARKKVAENPGKYFMPDQFKNAANYLTHYQSTALEIWQQTGGKIDYLVCALGTSGTIMGLSKFTEEHGGSYRACHLRSVADRHPGDDRERGGHHHGSQDHRRRGYFRRNEQRCRHARSRPYRTAYRRREHSGGLPRPRGEIPQHRHVRGAAIILLQSMFPYIMPKKKQQGLDSKRLLDIPMGIATPDRTHIFEGK